jgi:hypothetical protein
MAIRLLIFFAAGLASPIAAHAQDTPVAAANKPTEHLLGTISATDPSNHTISIKDDKSGAITVVSIADTKTLFKVAPGAKDLKSATRITGDQLETGDRVDVRGSKATDDPAKITARSVVLMSARDLQVAHAAQAEEWQHSIAATAIAVDAASGTITANSRTPQGTKPISIATSGQTEFMRYAPATPGKPARSQITDIHPGDQVRILGEASADGASVTAKKIYSGTFRTLNGTVASIAADGKQIVVKDLATKKPVTILLTESSTIHKLPPEMAAALARRTNRAPANGEAPAQTRSDHPPNGNGMRGGHGDISQMIERLPKIGIADLKPGDAVVVAGADADTGLVATNVIAGVEPILQAAPSRQGGQALGGDWGIGEMEAPQ